MNNTKKTAIIILSTFTAVIITLLAFIPAENKKQKYAEWGNIAVLAETDQRAQYIIDNKQIYPESIIDILRTDPEGEIEFVYNYPFHKNDYNTMSYTAEELDGRVPALYMSDTRWCYQTINDYFFLKYQGCVPVSLTMAYIALTGKTDLDPYKITLIAGDIDALADFGGIYNGMVAELIKTIGLNVVEYQFTNDNIQNIQKTDHADIQEMKSILDKGHVIMAAMGGDTFGYHAIIIRGYEEDSFYINDSEDEENSSKLWSFDELEPEMNYMWDIYA